MRSRAINFCRSFRVSVAVNLIPVCQSKDNKLEHVLSFFRTCSEFHLSGCHYKTFHSPKGTNTDLFHTLLALRSAFFFLCRSCFSAIGRQGGKQRISVGEGCEYKGTVMHEMMHALGFFHEQSRTDRDDYVMVLWWNVEPGTMREGRVKIHEE